MERHGPALLFAAVVIWLVVSAVAPSRDQPCVYDHSTLVDWLFAGEGKRTCKQMIDEANSRISHLTDQLNDQGGSGPGTPVQAPTLSGAPPPSEGD